MSLLMCTQHSKRWHCEAVKMQSTRLQGLRAEWQSVATHAVDIYCSGLLGSLCSHLVAIDLLCNFSSGDLQHGLRRGGLTFTIRGLFVMPSASG